jgi:hypothetical protein
MLVEMHAKPFIPSTKFTPLTIVAITNKKIILIKNGYA